MHVLNISSIFFCMLQLLHLDALKIDQMLHVGGVWEAADGVDDVQDGAGLLLGRLLASPTRSGARSFAKRVPSDASDLDWTSGR
jgi:hypothetical protein